MAKSRFRVAVAGARFGPLDYERKVLEGLRAEIAEGAGGEAASLLALCKEADAVLLGAAPRFTREVVEGLSRCRIIARYGIGVDNVDLEAAAARGIWATNVPDYCVEEVSDHAISLLLHFARKLGPAAAAVREGGWGIGELRPIAALRGQTLGLVGLGRIGRAVARKARAFGLRVLAHDPYLPAEAFRRARAEGVSLDALLGESHFVSIHAPLTPETRHIIGAAELQKMKPGAVLINVARGGLVDESALLAALGEGRLRGAGLDVVEEEPPPPDHPLRRMPHVLLTPHSAWYSERAEREMRLKAAREVARVLRGRAPRNPVNRPAPATGVPAGTRAERGCPPCR
ncbi:MAG: C-terminal binding protein [Nitrospinota bacterium]